MIQRSVSERRCEKMGSSTKSSRHPASECPHRAARRMRECGHTESKLHQQTRLGYVQSTPNVATIHNSRFGSANPRGVGVCTAGSSGTVGGSSANVSKIFSAMSDGELLDVAILPIFQKLLTERHKNAARTSYGASVASCPNISVKCDIVEYL